MPFYLGVILLGSKRAHYGHDELVDFLFLAISFEGFDIVNIGEKGLFYG